MEILFLYTGLKTEKVCIGEIEYDIIIKIYDNSTGKGKKWEIMIKVIASDMDGTLLNNNHRFSENTIQSIKKACDRGIRFMVVTGRNFVSAMQALDGTGLVCDYIVSSGAEIRDPQKEVKLSIALTFDECEYLYEKLKKYPIAIMFCSELENYMLGTFEEADQGLLNYIK